MRLLVKLSFQNLKAFFKESILVVVSIMLTVSLLSMVTATMYGIYDLVAQTEIKEIRTSIYINGEFNPYEVLEGFGLEHIAGYSITMDSGGYYAPQINNEFDYNVEVFNNLDPSINESGTFAGSIITKGRLSTGIHELNVLKNSGYSIGDAIELFDPNTGEKIVSEVVGIFDYGSFVSYYEPLDMGVNYKGGNTELDIILVDGTKNLESLINGITGHLNAETIVYTNEIYNYFKGFSPIVPEVVYLFIAITLVLFILITGVTLSFLYNAFNVFMSRRHRVFGLLRSVGTTRKQLIALMTVEGTVLGTVGYVFGTLLGLGMSAVLASIINSTISSINILQGGSQPSVLKPQMPVLAFCLLGIFMFLVLVLVVALAVNRVFKRSAISVVNEKNVVMSKKRMNLKGDTIRSLAKINIKRTKSFKSIRSTLIVSMVLLLSLTTWTDILAVFGESNESIYDTSLSVNIPNNKGSLSDLFDDTLLMESVLKEKLSIDRSYLYVGTGAYRIKADFLENKEFSDYLQKHNLGETFDSVDFMEEETFLVILKDEEFELMAKGLGVTDIAVGGGILKDGLELAYVLDEIGEPKLTGLSMSYGSKVTDLKDTMTYRGTTIVLPENSKVKVHSSEDEDKSFEITVYKTVFDLGMDYNGSSDSARELYISESTYDQVAKKVKVEDARMSSRIKLRTHMEDEELSLLGRLVSDYGGTTTFDYYSDALTKTMQRNIVGGIKKAAFLVFGYILMFIAINIISVSLVNNEERTSDIASLRSVGMSNEQMRTLFIYESLAIMGKGWLMGVIIAHGVGFTSYSLVKHYTKMSDIISLKPYSFNFDLLLLTFFITLLTIIGQVLLANIRSKEVSIVEGMRKIG